MASRCVKICQVSKFVSNFAKMNYGKGRQGTDQQLLELFGREELDAILRTSAAH